MKSFPLPTKPEDIIPSLIERFNSGEVSNQMAMYDPEAIFIANDGRTITDHAEIASIIGRDIKLGLSLMTNVRHLFVAGDIVQIILDWSIEGKGHDGKQVHLGGRHAISHDAVQMDAGDILSTIIREQRCGSPADLFKLWQLPAAI